MATGRTRINTELQITHILRAEGPSQKMCCSEDLVVPSDMLDNTNTELTQNTKYNRYFLGLIDQKVNLRRD